MSYDKFLRESSGMGPVPKAQSSGSARSRRTRGRKGFKGEGKGKDHFPRRGTNVHGNPRDTSEVTGVTYSRSPRMKGGD